MNLILYHQVLLRKGYPAKLDCYSLAQIITRLTLVGRIMNSHGDVVRLRVSISLCLQYKLQETFSEKCSTSLTQSETLLSFLR